MLQSRPEKENESIRRRSGAAKPQNRSATKDSKRESENLHAAHAFLGNFRVCEWSTKIAVFFSVENGAEEGCNNIVLAAFPDKVDGVLSTV